ncbi:hypothetical protein [Paracraurococcus lichenis]|uniref:Nucleoside-specific outer membrane channel protein Tsx n=1 Tax=Paracraurococcus lichenis TaxID=3064888 RepID=A0ABT9DYS4_9PROT|nr:hypothetical protein [Paracraurococcus sp. LOR1-02]MDO9709051.1 hypothetical protein [Paracraurococcus sp. LOR1-02]
MNRTLLAACLLTLAAVPALAQTLDENRGAAPPGFSDNSVSWRYGWAFKEPGVTNERHANGIEIPKHILTFTHVDGGTMWSNFINIDALFSTGRDPAKGGGSGAIEVYGIYRGDLSLNEATRSRIFSYGTVLQDVSLQIGGDFNTKNDEFSSAKKLLVFGPDFHWNIPGGFLSTAVQFSKEWNNNGIVDKAVSFDPAFEAEVVWSVPLAFTRLPLSFEGFGNMVGPKGKDGFGFGTKTEVLTEPRLNLDVGAIAFDKPHRLDAFIGYQYWLNKFGNDHTRVPGALANAFFVGLRYHL